MIDPRSASPHPSLSSSGSEEVRCSLDELDAVIATFDEEAKQCQVFTQLANEHSTLLSGHHNKHRGSLFVEHTPFAASYDAVDYASATLQNPTRTRSTMESIQASLLFKTSDNSSPTQDDEFPPPPPDAFAPENFILPPPSPPPSPPEVRQSLSVEPNHPLNSSSAQTAINSATNTNGLDSAISGDPGISNTSSDNIISNPSSSASSVPVERKSNIRTAATGTCRRPAVPQRAPSTRLSTVSASTVHTMGEVRPQSMTFESPPSQTTHALPNQQLKSSLSDQVSPDLRPNSRGTDALIDETVPPVSDIIRQFDRFGTITGTLCRPVVSQTKCAGATKHERPHVNAVTSVSQYPVCITSEEPKSLLSTNSFGFTTLKSNDDEFGVIPSSTVHQLNRGLNVSRSTSIDNSRLTNTVPGSIPLIRKINRTTISSPNAVLDKGPILSDPGGPLRKLSSPYSSQMTSPKHLVSDSTFNGLPGCSTLSSFGSPTSQSSSRNSPPLPSPPPPPTPPTQLLSSRLNLVGHGQIDSSNTCSPTHVSGSQSSPLPPSPPPNIQNPNVCPVGRAGNSSAEVLRSNSTLDHSKQLNSHVIHQLTSALQRQASTENRSSVDTLSVHAMRLDPNTLETLVQYNIVEAHQIPGYQPVPNGLPDWKTHKLERKNRVAADAYAADLRKWGCVPQWKRELIEKRQMVKTDVTTTRANDGNDSRAETLISAELTEKLQRRLEKVAATGES